MWPLWVYLRCVDYTLTIWTHFSDHSVLQSSPSQLLWSVSLEARFIGIAFLNKISHVGKHYHLFPKRCLSNNWVFLETDAANSTPTEASVAAAAATVVDVSWVSNFTPHIATPIEENKEETADQELLPTAKTLEKLMRGATKTDCWVLPSGRQ